LGDTKKLQIRGTAVSYCDIRRDEVGTFTRVHCESDLTAAVANFFSWEILKENDAIISGPKSMKMDNELALTTFSLEPTDFNGKNVLEFDAERVSDFSINRVKTEAGGTATKLRFTVRSRAKGTSATIERFMESIGEGVGLLKLTYPKNAQSEMFASDGATAEPETETDEPIEKEVRGPVLASAREVGERSRPGRNSNRSAN